MELSKKKGQVLKLGQVMCYGNTSALQPYIKYTKFKYCQIRNLAVKSIFFVTN